MGGGSCLCLPPRQPPLPQADPAPAPICPISSQSCRPHHHRDPALHPRRHAGCTQRQREDIQKDQWAKIIYTLIFSPACLLPRKKPESLAQPVQMQEAKIAACPLRIPSCFFNTIKCLHAVWTLETLTKLAEPRAAAQAFNCLKWHHFLSWLCTSSIHPCSEPSQVASGSSREAGRGSSVPSSRGCNWRRETPPRAALWALQMGTASPMQGAAQSASIFLAFPPSPCLPPRSTRHFGVMVGVSPSHLRLLTYVPR